jgi:hypothetical protein
MVTTTLPRVTDQPRWRVAVDTVDGAVDGLTPGTRYASATDPFRLDPHSLIALLPLA